LLDISSNNHCTRLLLRLQTAGVKHRSLGRCWRRALEFGTIAAVSATTRTVLVVVVVVVVVVVFVVFVVFVVADEQSGLEACDS
jgi:ABC-type bacteriocin/lantibiotic exporter with double-glycine peptidase domain